MTRTVSVVVVVACWALASVRFFLSAQGCKMEHTVEVAVAVSVTIVVVGSAETVMVVEEVGVTVL